MENKGKYMNVLSLKCVHLYIYEMLHVLFTALSNTQANLFIYLYSLYLTILSIVMNV